MLFAWVQYDKKHFNFMEKNKMMAVIIAFDVIEGQESLFEQAWIDTTEAIYQHMGSLGSRLHRDENGRYIAYAQWTALADHGQSLPDAVKEARTRMRQTLVGGKPEVLHRLHGQVDLLKAFPHPTTGKSEQSI